MRWSDLLFVVLVAAAASAVVIESTADFHVRFAMAAADDGPLAYSYYFARPNEFAQDVYMQAWAPVAGASLMNFLPALSYKYLGLPPEIFFVAFTIAQSALLAMGTFYLATAMTQDRWVALVAAAFTILWRPQMWNLGLFGGLDTQAYAAWLALPFLVFALALIIRQRTIAALASLLVGGLIHPILGVCAAFIIGIYLAWNAKDWRQRSAIGFVAGVAALAFVPAIVTTWGLEQIPSPTRMQRLMENPHVVPWGLYYPFGIAAFTSSLLYVSLLGLLAWGADCADSVRRLLLSAIVATAAVCTVHILSIVVGIPEIAAMVLSRGSIVFIIVALPLAVQRILLAARTDIWSVPAAATFFIRASPISLLAAALVTLRLKNTLVRVFSVLLGTLIALLLVFREDHAYQAMINRAIVTPLLADWQPWLLADNRYYVFMFAGWLAVGVILFAMRWARVRAASAVVLAGILTFASIREARRNGPIETTGMPRDYLEAQLWARQNTPPGTGFLLVDTVAQSSWRGVAQRPALYRHPIGDGLYTNPAFALAYDKRLAEFYQTHAKDDAGWRAFGKTFGAEYLVERAALPRRELPEAFRNGSFVIYGLR